MATAQSQRSKQFLIDRILDQAKLEDVELTDIEIRMLGFAETIAGVRDLESAQAFERDIDDHVYEAKIAGLIRRAYERDKQNGNLEPWNHALAQIAGSDVYLHVMLELAGIEKTLCLRFFQTGISSYLDCFRLLYAWWAPW